MQCPKCRGAMQKITVDEIEVDRCGSCEGIWFDLREHEHLKEISGSQRIIDTGDPAKGKKTYTIRDIQCPRCGVKLVKLAFPNQPHIHYEQCATCGGAFMDAGEFSDYKRYSIPERIKFLLQPFRKRK